MQHASVGDAVDFHSLGYVRTAAVCPVLALGEPDSNATEIIRVVETLRERAVAIALFPELSVTGYSAEDLFFTNHLYEQTRTAMQRIVAASRGMMVVVGTPWRIDDGRLLNVAAVAANGKLVGVVPKSAHPNYGEFYERRWFVAAPDVNHFVQDPVFGEIRIGTAQLFDVAGTRVGIEICEDLWAPDSPGATLALAGAELMLNLSASNELVHKADYRRDLVRMTSAQRICGYLYASSGVFESTKDVVFGGHLIAAENGQMLAESSRFNTDTRTLIADFDTHKLGHDRVHNNTFANAPRRVTCHLTRTAITQPALADIERTYEQRPFVPSRSEHLATNAEEIFRIQSTGLFRRMVAAGTQNLVLGISGGLDSTLALLVCLKATELSGFGRRAVHALTMPGPGTTNHTRSTAVRLARAAGVTLETININAAVKRHLADLDHEARDDVVFENAQARERTQLLFNYANKVDGLVVGTGDLSELALGWCTFNGDHMAGYNVNASVPKTLVAYLVEWYADTHADKALARLLKRVLETPITPELIPHDEGQIVQETENIIGPYVLHDFFLFHYLRNGALPEKIYHLATRSFADDYPPDEIRKWLREFFRRFFTQQFKRTTLPPGPKVGSISLSPRGDWRMPDEASAQSILQRIEDL